MRLECVLVVLSAHFASSPPCPAQVDSSIANSHIRALAEPFRLDFGAMQVEPAPVLEATQDDWRVDVTATLWLTAMTGDIRTGPLTADVDASFSDVVDASDSLLGFAGRLEVGKGRWAGFIDGMYTNIGADDQTGLLGVASVDVTAEMLLTDFGLMYRVWDAPATNGARRNHSIDVLAGGRYQNIDVELSPEVLAARSQSKSWIDPIIGARGILQLSERFDVTLLGDVGGFGVSSDLTWSLRGVFGYHFELFDIQTTAFAGYGALGTDFSEGSGLSTFEWDMILHGPIFGLTFSF